MASTPCVDGNGIRHDVFISFRGRDTRNNFTAHLHDALTRKGIDAYIDDRLEGGEKIESLLSKISESLVSVIVFSPKYADSQWCLDELVKIAECKVSSNQTVFPVFLQGVDPTHIRDQTGDFGDAFDKLLRYYPHNHKEHNWRRAMREIANIPECWDSKHKSEGQIVVEIVDSIEKLVNQLSLNELDFFVGRTRIICEVEPLLSISSEGVFSVGILGMSGIGQTAIAKIVFDSVSHAFDSACFLENVSENVREKGLDSLQKDMRAKLLKLDNSNKSLHILSRLDQEKLSRMKVLIVLDDVSNRLQLKTLVGREDSYAPGSRIIVTSTDKQVLNGCTKVYEVEKLNNPEALELFKFHAFKQSEPKEKFIELSRKAITYAQGLPSTLEDLGRNLYGKGLNVWESELAKLRETLNMRISDELQIASEGLEEN